MTEHRDSLPPEIGEKLMTFLCETNGEFEVSDMAGLLNFIAAYGEQHPALLGLIDINEDAVVEHFKRTGEVPPGARVIRTTTGEGGTNVTRLEVFRGPRSPKS